MFLLAWSFALNAVEYVRRKRITRLILSFIEESAFLDGQASLICRTIRERQHSSEPPSVVNRTQWRMNFLNGVETERCIYETDEIQIVIKPEKIILQEDAWNWRPSYWNFDIKYHKDRVSFLVRLAVYTRQKKHGQIYTQLDEPSTADDEVSNTIGTEDNKSEENNANEFICHSDEELSSEFMDYLEDNAHLIAQHKNFRHLLYYESTLRDFYEIVFLWTEGKLFSNGTPIDEIYTVDVPFSHNFYGRSTSQSRQLSNLSENESSDSALNISKSHELSSSHLSLASSYNFPEDPPFSMLEMLYLKELIGNDLTTQFSSERHLNKLTTELCLDSTTKQSITGWSNDLVSSDVQEAEFCHPSSSSTYNHLSLRRNGTLCSTQRVKSLSPVKRGGLGEGMRTFNDTSLFKVMGTRSLCSFSKEIVPIYLKQFRKENEFPTKCPIDHSKFCQNNNDNRVIAKSNMSTSCFGEEDLGSMLKFRNSHLLFKNASTSNSSEINTPKNPDDDTPHILLDGDEVPLEKPLLHDLKPANYIKHREQEDVKSSKLKRASIAERIHHYRYVPTAEFAKRQNPNTTTEKCRRRLSSLEIILERYARSVAISHFNDNYNLPKYCGGWRFSREKIARYHQFALQRRLSSLVAGNHSETSRFLNQFLKMSLRAKDRLSASAICLNYRSSSSYPLPCSSAIADANIRTSAMNIFATDIKQRSQSFPRRNFFSNAVRNHEINGVGSDHCNNNNYDGDLLQRFNVNGSQKATKKFAKPSSKPPSILVYTGDQKELFSEIAASLVSILPRDVYVVRDLTTRALKYHPWSHEHCVCLIVASTQQLDDQAWSQLQHYFNNSGKMLFVCQNALLAGLTSCGSMKKQVNLLKSVFERKTCGGIFGKDFESFLKKSFRQLAKSQKINEIFHTKDAGGGYQFAVVLCKNIGQPFLLYMQTSENHKVRSCALFSDVTTDELLRNGELVADVLSRLGVDVSDHETAVVDGARTEANTPRLSFGYLFCQSDRLIHEIKGLTYGKTFNATLALTFQHFSNTLRNDDQPLPEPSADCLPIFVCRRAEKLEELKHCFDHIAYFDVLKTKRLGRTLLYVPTCTTTIDIAKSFSTVFPESDGILIASSYQIRGRGRSGNVWLSPMGCATFQFNFNIPSDTELGRSITFLQHIASVAIVDAILTQLGDKNFPIKIKWPNDIYYKRDFKLGGILVIASQQGAQFECSIGAGINVANSKPTVCINDFLTNGKALVIEEFLAEVMNKFEYYLNVFVHQGKAEFTKKYISYWMHNGEEVTIIHEEDNSRERVTIRSLDENGFLSVQSKETARMFSVQDDGNSFDIMHGLIHFKR